MHLMVPAILIFHTVAFINKTSLCVNGKLAPPFIHVTSCNLLHLLYVQYVCIYHKLKVVMGICLKVKDGLLAFNKILGYSTSKSLCGVNLHCLTWA